LKHGPAANPLTTLHESHIALSTEDRNAVLPDPRPAALQTAADEAALEAQLGRALEAGDDATVRSTLALPAHSVRAARLLSAAIDRRGEGIGLRFFAIPLVIVAGARNRLTVAGAIPELHVLRGLLEQHGAIGVTRNFGLGNALVSAEALDSLSPSALWRAAADPAQRAPFDALQPEPIAVTGSREQVHLRFLVGAGVTPQHLPSFLESASNIGTWGMPFTRELARQLAQPGLEILPMPRPPQPLTQAAHAGRRALLEAALSLFLGNTLRKFRMAVGDPEAVLSAHRLDSGAGELRLSLSTPFDDSLFEGYVWPLQPQDDVAEVSRLLHEALNECRVPSVTVVPQVLPERLAGGAIFVAGRMLGELGRTSASH
jgi:hypothetical protein